MNIIVLLIQQIPIYDLIEILLYVVGSIFSLFLVALSISAYRKTGLKKLEKKYQLEIGKQPNLSFASFIAESAIIELERRQILKEAQLISLVGFGEDSVILKDTKKENRLIEVQIRDKRPKCITDDKFDCIHVGFALALPEVRNALDK